LHPAGKPPGGAQPGTLPNPARKTGSAIATQQDKQFKSLNLMDFLAGLNPEQREAVAYAQGPLLILAGAGSGKTRVITHRIAHLIHAHRVPPSAVLAVTFTNKAAEQMGERVAKLLAGAYSLNGLIVSTFHSYAVRLLRRDGQSLADLRPGFTRNFTIYDEDDQLAVVKSVYRKQGLDEKQFMQYRAALSRISAAKNQKQSPDEMQQAATDQKARQLAAVFDEYNGRLRQSNALDFDDLLLESVRLLEHDSVVRTAWNRRLEHMLVDEYQDTNRSQYELIRLLTAGRRNICVVGDEDQSIYSWRGADIRNILDFERDFPDARVIRLEQNYRSTKNILESASALVAHNTERKGKWLWTASGEGARVGYYEAADAENEALFVADTIERTLREKPDDRIAVLYRTNFQSRQIEEALRRYGRRYKVIGGFSFYQRAEVKDVLAYLKSLISAQDSISLLRIINTPARAIGKSTVEQIERYALEHGLSVWGAIVRMLDERLFPTRAESALASFRSLMEDLRGVAETRPLRETVEAVVERTGYIRMLKADDSLDADSRIENLQELGNAAAEAGERGETIAEFLDHAALVSDADAIDIEAQVSLMTVHNAKGLEFPVVFVTGLEEGLFPHGRSVDTPSMMEEERRLCYVAMTRAEKRLILTWARYRRRWGGGPGEVSIASRFLAEVPRSLIDNLGRTPATEVDLGAERHMAREAVRKNLYTGKTYNSLENIQEFFAARGVSKPPQQAAPPLVVPPRKPATPPPAAGPGKGRFAAGTEVQHPKYGRGTIIRREGDGEDAKLTVSFPGYGLKKIVEKYAGLKRDE
jgi:DNA helicase II / ATP-dependent DNA helicase PcrA